MNDISALYRMLRETRAKVGLTQRELADLVGTSQSAVAAIESGQSNPTLQTVIRMADELDVCVQIELVPRTVNDPVIDRYKLDVDRASILENLRKSTDERLRTLAEWQEAGRELEQATRSAKTAARASGGSVARSQNAGDPSTQPH